MPEVTVRQGCLPQSRHRPSATNQAIGDRLGMARKTVEAHIANIFSKLELEPMSDDHRRVLAVLAHLRGPSSSMP